MTHRSPQSDCNRTGMLIGGLLLLSALLVGLYFIESARREKLPSTIDIGFSQAMASHHEQAVLMANLLLDGEATGLRPIAQTIATQQAIELGYFRAWLSIWQAPFTHDYTMSWMRSANAPLDPSLLQYIARCAASPDRMPGNATPAEIHALRQARGRERDKLFLELMLRHHEGAIPMAKFAARAAKLPVVSRLARQIVTEQAKEIQQFKSMLAVLQNQAANVPANANTKDL